MGTYLETIRLSVLWFPIVFLLAIPAIIFIQRRRYGEIHEYRVASAFALGLALFTAALLTTLPLPSNAETVCARRSSVTLIQPYPFGSVQFIVSEAKRQEGLSWIGLLTNRGLWQILLNFLMLVPVGFFLRAMWRTQWWQAFIVGLGLSLVFELTQLTGVLGLAPCPYRVFDVDDLITNSTGAAFGWWVAGWKLFKWLPSPRLNERNLWYRKKKPPPQN